MKLLILAASHRTGSFNRKLAKLSEAHAASRQVESDFAEYGEFDMPLYNDDTATSSGVPLIARRFGERMAHADGIILSSPEYNWSYPGSIKNILDWTSRLDPNPLAGKTALLMSATPGSRGGIVGLSHLRTSFEALQIFVYPRFFTLGAAPKAFDADDRISDKKQQDLFIRLLDDYIDFTRKLSQP